MFACHPLEVKSQTATTLPKLLHWNRGLLVAKFCFNWQQSLCSRQIFQVLWKCSSWHKDLTATVAGYHSSKQYLHSCRGCLPLWPGHSWVNMYPICLWPCTHQLVLLQRNVILAELHYCWMCLCLKWYRTDLQSPSEAQCSSLKFVSAYLLMSNVQDTSMLGYIFVSSDCPPPRCSITSNGHDMLCANDLCWTKWSTPRLQNFPLLVQCTYSLAWL